MTKPQTLRGVAAAVGVAVGRAFVVDPRGRRMPARHLPQGTSEAEAVEAEVARFERAVTSAHQELVDAQRVMGGVAEGPVGAILEAHRQLTRDPMLREEVVATIRSAGRRAESALALVTRGYIQKLLAAETEYLRERAHDVEQVAAHLQAALLGSQESLNPPPGSVLVVRDLAPAQAVRMRDRGIVALVAVTGSATSHTALLARALGIPAVVGVHEALRIIAPGAELVVDGFEGHCHLHPSAEKRDQALARAARFDHFITALRARANEPLKTRDGVPIALRANIELAEEASVLRDAGAAGVGLFRTEYLYLSVDEPPSEAAQEQAYASVLEHVKPDPVTFRTFDLGADKLPTALQWHQTALNPALGPRGLRLALGAPELLRAQLRAVLRAAAGFPKGAAELLFPMVAHRGELSAAIEMLAEERARLGPEGPVQAVPVGAMVELPAAVAMVDALLPLVDFVALGTNDLLQYGLAVDRGDPDSSDWAKPYEPYLLRSVNHVLEHARSANKGVRVCGDAAADPIALPVLLGLGARVFSLPTAALPLAAATVRQLDIAQLEPMAQRVLRAADANEVRALVLDELQETLAELWAEQGFDPAAH